MSALTVFALVLVMGLEVLSPLKVVLSALAFIPVLAGTWLLSRQLALVLVLIAIGLRVIASVLRHDDPATSAVDVLALGSVGAMVLFISGVASRESQLTSIQLAERLRQAAARSERPPGHDPTATRVATTQRRLAGLLAWRQGDLQSARRIGQSSLRLLHWARDSRPAVRAANELAWIEGLMGHAAAQERMAREALRWAELSGDDAAQMGALNSLGCAAMLRGNFGGAEAALRRGIAVAESGGGLDAGSQHALLAVCQALSGRLLEARTRSNPLRRRRGLGVTADDASTLIHWLGGQFAAAIGSLDTIRRRPGRLHPSHDWTIAFAAISAAELGRPAEGLAYLTEVRALYERRDYALHTYLFGWAAGLVAWQQGSLSQASRELEAAADGLLAIEALPAAAFVLVDLAELASQSPAPELARRAAERLRSIAARLNEDLYRALGWIASGWSSLASNELPAAPHSIQRAAEVLDAGHYLAYCARSQHLLAHVLQRTDRARAISAMNRAAAIHRETGAAWRERRAAKALRHLRQATQRPAQLGPHALTKREREVTRLAALGQSAREIAEQLVVAERTVETHLANAYAKLGVHSRVDLMRLVDKLEAPAVARADLVPQ